MIKPLSLLGALIMLASCGGDKLAHYQDMQPGMDIREYFNGSIKAWGIVQDWSGKVVSRFDVEMAGVWEGDVGTLTEDFNYYDGSTQQRVWTITRQGDGQFTGKAGDIIGEAKGTQTGNAVNWSYVMDVPVDDTTYRLHFDDWMWLMNDGVLINRTKMKKFGITVAELTLFMQKQ